MSGMDTAPLRMLERFLDLTAFRQSLIAGNLANIDTPGYRTRDIDFRGELRRAVAEQTSELTTPFVRPVPGLIERPDGNDVSIDRESLLLAQLQLQFRVGVQLLRAEMQQLRIAITEGR